MIGSRHFKAAELACPCCGLSRVSPRLLVALEDLRARLGHRPIIVTSGFRCPAHNRAVGGSPGSRHLVGQAADVIVPGLDFRTVWTQARLVPALVRGGIGLYPDSGHVHLDVRPDGPARWAVRSGQWIDPADLLFEGEIDDDRV